MLQKKIENLYSEFIAKRTYTRWIDEESRRESWEEAVDRYARHFNKYVPDSLSESYFNAIKLKQDKEVMGSMRALWSAGPALEENSFAAYNCAFIALDSKEAFGETLYVMMHGTGVGFSVERQFTTLLPVVPSEFTDSETVHVVGDSKLGWKNAFDHCIESLYSGIVPKFDYSQVRPKGARLNTFGGRASGPEPLKQLFNFTIRIFSNAKGRKLNSLEVHDITTKIGECVHVGGVRRSACISFSNLSDQRMKHAKDGNFWSENPQRAMANNSVAYTEKPDSAMFMEEWLNLLRSGSGERGIFNVETARAKADKFGRMEGEVRSNPCCFTGDMRILTANGYKPLAELSDTYVTLIDMNGRASDGKVWSNGVKDVVSINFWNDEFDSVVSTDDHRIMTADGNICLAKDLIGKRVMPYFTVRRDFAGNAFFAGYILGDGNLTRLNSVEHKGLEVNIGNKDGDIAEILQLEVKGRTAYSVEARTVALHYGLDAKPLPERGFPSFDFTKSELIDFLSGLYSANGSVIKGHRVALKTTNRGLANTVKDKLESLGIASYITTNKPTKVKFDNGEYLCKESYDLNITRLKSIIKFAELISFGQWYKQAALAELIKTKAPVVKSVTSAGSAEVFDFEEPNTHWGVVEGTVVHNCEALLMSRQLCNLTETVVRPEDTLETLKQKIEAAVLLGCLQSLETNFGDNVSPKWKEYAEAERLIGASLTGLCDSPLFRKVNDKSSKLLRELRDHAHNYTKYVSKELGIVSPKQVTVVKPSGTISQLCNTSSGIHTRYSDYYIRRVRVNAKDPIALLLISKGVPCNPEVGQTWEDYNTLVFEFPMKSPRGSLTRDDMTALEQLEYWKMVNDNWCDGNPSCTVYVKSDEWVEVGAWVYKNWDSICGLSFLPYDGGNYPLAPYEEIKKAQYHELCKMYEKVDIDFDAELDQFEKDDNTTGAQTLACTGGSCELV